MSHSGRTPIRALCAALTLVLVSACRTPDVRSELADSGFRTPEQTFETFRAAFVSDLPGVEFRCLSSDFRAAYGVSEFNYLEGREIWLGNQPFRRWGIGRAKILEVERTQPDRARLIARSKSWVHQIDFEILLAREDFYEVYIDGERFDDDYRDWEDSFRAKKQGDTWWVDGYVAIQNPEVLDKPERIEEITELRFGREWKIDGFRQLDED